MNKHYSKILSKICLFGLFALLLACVEEIDNQSFTYEKRMVVDANISDRAKAHEVRLLFTSPVDSESEDEANAVTGASVWVEDDLGQITNFIENEPGLYLSPADFAGVAGRSYALFIVNSEGKKYQSSFERLVPSPEISQIYNRFSIQASGQNADTDPGIQFFIDVENAAQGSQFYRYEWTDAHQVIVPYPKQWAAVRENSEYYTIVPFDLDVSECYREGSFSELVLATSTNNSNGQLKEVPIKFAKASSFEVTSMYSIEISQRSISPEAYSYYRKIELFNESNGSLFDRQQGTIIGNIKSVDDPDEEVLGYFEVSGIASKRVFYSVDELAAPVQDYISRPCITYFPIMVEGSVESFYQALDVEESSRGSEVAKRSLYELFNYFDGTGEKQFAHRLCTDCRRSGSLEKPAYWP